MSYLANRNVSIFNSTVTASTLKASAMTYSTLVGSTITASSIFTPAMVGTVILGQNVTYPNRYLEVGTDASNTMYLDFHSHDSVLPDYSTRIQSIGGSTIGAGNMSIFGSTIGLMPYAGVGIGTTAPSQLLHVFGTGAPAILIKSNSGGTSGNTASLLLSNAAYSSASVVGIENANAYGGTWGGDLAFNTYYNSQLYERMRITATGNVGIGTMAPDYRLKIEQGLSNNSNGLFISNSNYGSMQGLNISMVNAGSGNFNSYAALQGYTSGVSGVTQVCLQPTSGNVGINLTNPTANLHVYATAKPTSLSKEYSFIVNAADSFNGNGSTTVYGGNTINLKAGDLIWGTSTRSYGSQIVIESGYSVNGTVNHAPIMMYTAGTERVRISEGGNVGIGTNNPGNNRLQIVKALGTSDYTYTAQHNGQLRILGPGAKALEVAVLDNGQGVIQVTEAGTGYNQLLLNPVTGNVGIGTNSPSYTLHVVGGIYATGDIIGLSDRRFKHDITPLTDSLSKLQQLHGYTYGIEDDTRKHMGLLAQEVETVFPEAVYFDEKNDKYGLNYNAMVAPLIDAVKELSSENQRLTQQLSSIIAWATSQGYHA
jgi:hypothetical protein